MAIVGLDEVTLTTEDLAAGRRYLADYGLIEARADDKELVFWASDRTGVRVRHCEDPDLPPAPVSGPTIRLARWGVSDRAALERIANELGRDRPVQVTGDLLISTDDDGNAIGFQVTQRIELKNEPAKANVPGAPPQRVVNTTIDFDAPIVPATLSHLVYYTQDVARLERFYVERLGFRATDRFTNMGSFMRTDGNPEHHQLFLVQRAPFKGLHHIAFHLHDMNQVMLAGKRFADKGYQTAWGPGRHIYGANVFWYFNSPFGGNIEYDADMDVVDDHWVPRETAPGPSTSNVWNFGYPPPPRH